LRTLVGALSRFLAWLITGSGAVPGDLHEQFLRLHDTVAARLVHVDNQINVITDTDDPVWQQLEHAGLNGDALHLQVAIWQRLTAATAAPPPPPRARGARVLARLLRYVKSLLSSLAVVFPAVGIAESYTENVEAVVDYDRAKDPPPGVLKL
jgi:hypothetical protein